MYRGRFYALPDHVVREWRGRGNDRFVTLSCIGAVVERVVYQVSSSIP